MPGVGNINIRILPVSVGRHIHLILKLAWIYDSCVFYHCVNVRNNSSFILSYFFSDTFLGYWSLLMYWNYPKRVMVNCFIKAGQTPDITEPYYCQYSSLYFLEPEIQIQKSSPILLVMREDTIQSRMQALRLFGIRYLLHKRARENMGSIAIIYCKM